MKKTQLIISSVVITFLSGTFASAASDSDINSLRSEINKIKQVYESRINDLELKLAKMEKENDSARKTTSSPISSNVSGEKKTGSNNFNPQIGLILNGKYSNFSAANSEIKGFGTPGEGSRSEEGIKLGESELNLSSNIDDKFSGNLTLSLVNEDGEDGVEIEEAFFQTLPGAGLPKGMNLKAGRSLWTLGYLNEQHLHTDDFADRPLPYRVFLNNAYNDDGAEISYVLPSDIYSEVGGGLFRGDDYPFGNANGASNSSWSAFARIGGDIKDDQTWRIGTYVLSGDTTERLSNEDEVTFSGNSNLYIADIRYTFAPTGNSKEKEILLQGEYFLRDGNGIYEDASNATGEVNFNEQSSGWYIQGVYKFDPQWRVGYRYSQLQSPNIPLGLVGSTLDSNGNNPDSHTFMLDWSHSEFSRVRLQYNHENMEKGQDDNQIILQYIMSLGAHGAHKY